MSEPEIYLDNAATTPVDPAVVEAMLECLGPSGEYANPSSIHAAGRRAHALVENARAEVGARVGAEPDRLVFTSGATESNNLALTGALAAPGGPRRLITMRIEHKSVLDTARAAARGGVDVTWLGCDARGLVDLDELAAALAGAPALVSVMHVNNEIGVVQDIGRIAEIAHARGAIVHVDAAQSAGKLELDVAALGLDLCSLTAHKLHGPKGVGALYVRAGLRLEPRMHGGAQERALRPGTLATHQIVGMGRAFALAHPADEGPRLAALRRALWDGLADIDGVRLNGHPERSAPHILNVSFPGVDGESLRAALADIAVSEGSACASDVPEPSHVLSSLGLSEPVAQAALRLSVGRFTAPADVERAARRVAAEVGRLRALAAGAPAWCST